MGSEAPACAAVTHRYDSAGLPLLQNKPYIDRMSPLGAQGSRDLPFAAAAAAGPGIRLSGLLEGVDGRSCYPCRHLHMERTLRSLL